MHGRRVFLLAGLLLVAGLASAQEPDPSVNDSDYDTTVPTDDEAYLASDETAAQESTDDPTVSDSDFDTSVPTNDEAYLDAPVDEGAAPDAAAKGTPAVGAALALAAVGALALALRRKA